MGAPQVNYRESISKNSEVRYVHKKQSGGSGQFADVMVRFEPLEPGSGFEFKSEIKGGAVPKVRDPFARSLWFLAEPRSQSRGVAHAHTHARARVLGPLRSTSPA